MTDQPTSQQASKRIDSLHPMHILLLADDSNSMQEATDGSTAAQDATRAVRNWIAALQKKTKFKKPWFRFSLIRFGSNVEVIHAARDVRNIKASAITLDGTSGVTRLDLALKAAREFIADDGADEAHNPPFVFLFTDGVPTDANGAPTDVTATLQEAEAIKQMDLPCGAPRIVALGFGACSKDFLRQLATSTPKGPLFREVSSSKVLIETLPAMGTPTCTEDDDDDEAGTLGSFEDGIVEPNVGTV